MALPLYAGECELQYKVTDLRQEIGYTAGQYLRPTTRSAERLSAEPKYRSRMPLYVVAQLGNGADKRYTIVLDESKGTGRGYDILYVDRNNNENLTDDQRIAGRIRQQGTSYTTATFGPIEVMVDYGDRTTPYYFSVEYNRYGESGIRLGAREVHNMNLRLQTSGYYTGVVLLGSSERRIAIVDFNGNGLFNEFFKPRYDMRGPEGRLYAIGDQILIDVNGDGRFESGELYPYAKHLQVDGKWHSLGIVAHGATVAVQEPDLKLGTLQIPDKKGSCSLQLASKGGILKLEETGQDIQVPADTYQVYAHTIQVPHSSGNWRYEAYGTTSSKKFQVAEESVLPLSFGAPILVNISHRARGSQYVQPKAGDTIQLSLTFSGQGGETYTNIEKNGRRPTAPTFKVVNEAGKIVDKGTFKYG